MIIDTHIAGIPCQAELHEFSCVPPWQGLKISCPSDNDYYGCTVVEFTILDRKGYSAKWLENKMTQEDIERIEKEFKTAVKEETGNV